MNQVVILGAGPAACLLAISLARHGLRAVVIGRPRTSHAVEGLSQRVVEALGQLGCGEALSLLGPRWSRVSCWNGQAIEMNGEFVVERVAFDAALMRDARAAGIDLREGRVRELERHPDDAWCVSWEDAAGRAQRTLAGLVAECRGHTAPKVAPDLYAGPTLVSLGRTFEGARAQPRTAFIESFPSGWAWGGVDPLGQAYIQVVTVPETLRAHGGDLDAAHAHCVSRLVHLPERFGRRLQPAGATRARGIQPALRGGIAATDCLRIGDAAYSGDPLSGHGVFEAASGAFAAAPVVNTLLRRPERATLALRYLRERAESLFHSRIEAARTHYASETRWPESAFWRRMSRPGATGRPAALLAARFLSLPVVEDGFIVERRVVVSDEHPRGVRFIDGVDLGQLDDLLHVGAVSRLSELSGRLGAPREAVGCALRWLQARHLANPRAGADPARPSTIVEE